MKQITNLLLGFAALVSVLSCQSNKRANNYNNKALVDDSGLLFLTNATEASLTEIKASGLVMANSRNQQVIRFAKMLIDDHTQLTTDLKKLQTDNFVTSEDSINSVHRQMIAGLEKKRAGAFDKAYMQQIINEHEQQIALFKAAGNDKNINVSDFAKNTIPALKAHLDSARALSLTLK